MDKVKISHFLFVIVRLLEYLSWLRWFNNCCYYYYYYLIIDDVVMVGTLMVAISGGCYGVDGRGVASIYKN